MGNLFSVEDDLFQPRENLCGLSNDQISYITRQYMTILKAKETLTLIIDKTPEINNPCKLIFPLSDILQDLLNMTPLETTIKIFNPRQELVYDTLAKQGNVPAYKTVLDDYNVFFANQYAELTTPKKIEMCKKLLSELEIAENNALEVLLQTCTNENGTCGVPEE